MPVGTSHSRKIEKENLSVEVHLGSLSSVLVGHRDLRAFYFGLFPTLLVLISVSLFLWHIITSK